MTVLAKMHGAGNDFVVIAASPPATPRDAAFVRAVSDRRFGVGADGVLFLEREDDAAVRMHFYNCDGGRAGLCLNGSRCVALRAVELGWVEGRFAIVTDHRRLHAEVLSRRDAEAQVKLWFERVRARGEELLLPGPAPARTGFAVHTGDPHLVVEVPASTLESDEFEDMARPLRWWKGPSREGSNVHFVTREGTNWSIRSFERGIEGETLACGSGCVSAVAALAPHAEEEIALRVRGGATLRIDPRGDTWTLQGPARRVFLTEWESGSEEASLEG